MCWTISANRQLKKFSERLFRHPPPCFSVSWQREESDSHFEPPTFCFVLKAPEDPAPNVSRKLALKETLYNDTQIAMSVANFCNYLKREAPPSAITLSTLAAWQRRILKRISLLGRDGENGAGEEDNKGVQLATEKNNPVLDIHRLCSRCHSHRPTPGTALNDIYTTSLCVLFRLCLLGWTVTKRQMSLQRL